MRQAVVLGVLLFLSGCIPFLSNEQQNALSHTKEERVQMFKRDKDREVGLPYYFYNSSEQEWCEATQCIKVDDKTTEYTPKEDSTKKCVIAWNVDTTSKGPYHHPNGMVFNIAGMKKSWRYV